MSSILEFGVVILAGALLLAFIFLRNRFTPTFRDIPAFVRLKRAMGISVEEGTRLHISLGRGQLQTPRGASALAGLGMLRQVAEQTSISDKPTIVTSGDGALAILTRDTLQAAYKAAAAEELYSPSTGRLTGLTPFSYAAGAIPAMRDENVSTNVIIGNFGAEIALLTDASERANSFSVAAADEPTAQAILYASVDEPLIGEELFAAGAYANAGPAHRASLQAEDILRWLIILVLLGGSVLKLIGLF